MSSRRRIEGRVAISAVAVAVSAILAQTAYAQSADATLRGTAPANAEVTAKNAATGLVRHVKAGADGSYTIVGLPPGDYAVDAGSGTEQTVTLSVASVATLNLDAQLETVTVSATRRLVEVKTSQVANDISLHQIETTPQISRNFLEFADAVPGMAFQVDAGGKTSLHSGAQDTSSTNVYIDGVGQKNYVRSGGITGQAGSDKSFGSRAPGDNGNPFPQLAIGEYKVITSNYKAEYDQISGAAITAETKSGTNEFHGEVFGNYTTGSWRSTTPAEELGGAKLGAASKEFGFALGGPIILDKLHYFVTYEGKKFATPDIIKPPFMTDDAGVVLHPENFMSADLRAQYGSISNAFNEDLYFGKLDWEATDRDRLEFSVKLRREHQLAGTGGTVAASAAYKYLNEDVRTQLRWQRSGDRVVNDLLLTSEDTNDQPTAITHGPGSQYVFMNPRTDGNGRPYYEYRPLLQIDGQGARTYFHAKQQGVGVQDDVTLPAVSWAGDHTLKMGVKAKFVKLTASDASTDALYSYYVTSAGVADIPFQVFYGNKITANGTAITAVSKNEQYGIYFQDDWAVNSHLTWNLGIRYDYEKTPTYTDFVTPSRFVDAINGPDTQIPVGDPLYGQTYAQSLAAGGPGYAIHINDYISNGHNRKNPGNEIQPRLGFSFDLAGDQKHVIFGGVGRAFDRNVFDSIQKESTKAAISEPTVQFRVPSPNPSAGCSDTQPVTPNCIDWIDAYGTPDGLQTIGQGTGDVWLINNNLKAPYTDQYSLGMRNRIGDWNTSVTIARLNSHDGLIANGASNRAPDGQWWSDAWGDYGHGVPGIGNLFLVDNAKETRNTEVLLSANRAYSAESRWSASFAYTYTNASENVYYSDDYQQDNPITRLIPMHGSPAAPRHRFVAVGSVDGPWGISFAGKLTLETVKYNLGFSDWTYDPVGHYPYASRLVPGDKFLIGGNNFGYRSIDVQATKNFKLPGGFSLQTRLDVLNLTDYRNYDAGAAYNWVPDGAVVFSPGSAIVGVPRTVKLTLSMKW